MKKIAQVHPVRRRRSGVAHPFSAETEGGEILRRLAVDATQVSGDSPMPPIDGAPEKHRRTQGARRALFVAWAPRLARPALR